MKWMRSLSRFTPSASAMSCGPSAEPPMPMDSTSVKRGALGGVISFLCTAVAKACTSSTLLWIALVSSGSGARPGARSQ